MLRKYGGVEQTVNDSRKGQETREKAQLLGSGWALP